MKTSTQKITGLVALAVFGPLLLKVVEIAYTAVIVLN